MVMSETPATYPLMAAIFNDAFAVLAEYTNERVLRFDLP
jgi:hypothetical protein